MRGFTLLEVVTVAFIVVVGMGGAFALIQRTISNVSFVEHRTIAFSLAQEGMEAVRAIRDSNFIDENRGGISIFQSNGLSAAVCGTGCNIRCVELPATKFFPLCPPPTLTPGLVEIQLLPFLYAIRFYGDTAPYTEAPASAGGDPTIFTRKAFITEPGTGGCPVADCIEVKVEVTWQEKGVPQEVELFTRLYNWLP